MTIYLIDTNITFATKLKATQFMKIRKFVGIFLLLLSTISFTSCNDDDKTLDYSYE